VNQLAKLQPGSLAAPVELRRMLARATKVPEAQTVEKQAKRLADLLALAGRVEEANEYAQITIEAARAVGEMLGLEVKQGERTDLTCPPKDKLPNATAATYRKLGRKPAEAVEAYKATCNESREIMSKAGFLRFGDGAHVAHNSGENEWYTPPQFLDAARETMGAIDLDPASCDLANENVKAAQFFSAEENGLDKDWSGNVWMNPPYAQPLIQQFCEKVLAEVAGGRVANACVLVNNGTETAWGQSLLREASAVCFPASRIRFIDKEGNPSGAPLQGQMIVYLGAAVNEFQQAFCKFGVVLLG
jgi:hypothetical protein